MPDFKPGDYITRKLTGGKYIVDDDNGATCVDETNSSDRPGRRVTGLELLNVQRLFEYHPDHLPRNDLQPGQVYEQVDNKDPRFMYVILQDGKYASFLNGVVRPIAGTSLWNPRYFKLVQH